MHVPTYLLALHDFRPLFNSPFLSGDKFGNFYSKSDDFFLKTPGHTGTQPVCYLENF